MSIKINTQDVIAKFKQVHGENTYDYSKVVYSKAKTPVTIICHKHGDFQQIPDVHLRGNGCKICGTERTNSSKVKTLEYYLPKFIEKHGNKYDYSKAVYIASDIPLTIICKQHGEFTQTPGNHAAGKGCPKCAYDSKGLGKRTGLQLTLEEFKSAHGDKYIYERVPENVKSTDKVEIFCKVHQEYFLQAPAQHKKGVGCPKCGREKSEAAKHTSPEAYLEEIKKVHGDTYILDKVVYKGTSERIVVTCRKHGDFLTWPADFKMGKGCRKCADDLMRSTTEDFIEKSKKIHGDLFDYSKVDYIDSKTKVTIICHTHGEFQQIPNGHLNGNGCVKCSKYISKAEQEIAEFLKECIEIEQSNKSLLGGLELDIYIPSKNLAIEYNGLYWHSDVKKDDNYHLNKYKACKEKGIRLIQIFEDEYRDKPEIVKSRLLNLIGQTPRKIYARQCELKEVSSAESMKFLADNHIQGALGATHRVGLYLKDELVSLMTFGQMRKVLGSSAKEGHYELLRFCNKIDTNVVGAASRSLKHFLKTAEPVEITSFADLRWSQGELYDTLGFDLEYQTEPNYFYTKGIDRENRFKYRKSELIRQGLDSNKTERQLMSEQGFYRIYDTGSLKYKLKTNK